MIYTRFLFLFLFLISSALFAQELSYKDLLSKCSYYISAAESKKIVIDQFCKSLEEKCAYAQLNPVIEDGLLSQVNQWMKIECERLDLRNEDACNWLATKFCSGLKRYGEGSVPLIR